MLGSVCVAPLILIEERPSADEIDEMVNGMSLAARAEDWTVACVPNLDEIIAKNGCPLARAVGWLIFAKRALRPRCFRMGRASDWLR